MHPWSAAVGDGISVEEGGVTIMGKSRCVEKIILLFVLLCYQYRVMIHITTFYFYFHDVFQTISTISTPNLTRTIRCILCSKLVSFRPKTKTATLFWLPIHQKNLYHSRPKKTINIQIAASSQEQTLKDNSYEAGASMAQITMGKRHIGH